MRVIVDAATIRFIIAPFHVEMAGRHRDHGHPRNSSSTGERRGSSAGQRSGPSDVFHNQAEAFLRARSIKPTRVITG
jgi:hypothetical protein